MTHLILLIIKVIISFIFVLLLARLMGRKLISEMTFFNFVTAVTLGTLAANLMVGSKFTTVDVTSVLLTLTVLTVISSWLTIKSPLLRKLMNSEPVTLIANGKIIKENLKRNQVSVSQLQMLLRQKNAFNIVDVEFALLEPDGKISVLLKSPKQPLTTSDLSIATAYKGLTADLIIDGEVQTENLKRINLNESWLKEQLQTRGIQENEEVFYAGLDSAGNLYVSL